MGQTHPSGTHIAKWDRHSPVGQTHPGRDEDRMGQPRPGLLLGVKMAQGSWSRAAGVHWGRATGEEGLGGALAAREGLGHREKAGKGRR